MFVTTVIVSIVLALALVVSAAMKLQHNPQVVAPIHDVVGVPMHDITRRGSRPAPRHSHGRRRRLERRRSRPRRVPTTSVGYSR